MAGALVSHGACAAGPAPGRPLSVPASQVESALRDAGRPLEPTVAIFAWRLNEQGSRLEGRGVARFEPPYRARLDLFTENGETAARATLVDDDLRTPPDVDERLVPPAPLLWASLGVFRPGASSELMGGRELDGGGIVLRYRLPDGRELRFLVRGDSIESVELTVGGRSVERIELEWTSGNRVPAAAVYRDLADFRELRVSRTSAEPTDPFDPEIWAVGGSVR